MNTDATANQAEQANNSATRFCKRDQLQRQLDEKIAEFGKEAEKHKKLYRGLRYLLFLLSGLSALLAGMARLIERFPCWFNAGVQ